MDAGNNLRVNYLGFFEPSPFIPSAFVLLLPFMTPLIRCTSVLLHGPPRAPFRLAAPSALSLLTFPSSHCFDFSFQVELDLQDACSLCMLLLLLVVMVVAN